MPIRNGYQINEPLSSEKEKLALPFLNALKVWSSNSDKVGTIDTLFSAMKESMENGALLYCPLNDNMQFMPISKQITGSSDDGSWMPVFTSHDALVRTPKCQYVLMPMKEYFKKVLEFGEIAGVMVNPGSTLQPFPKMMIEMFWNRFPSISSQSNPGRYGGVDLDNYMAAFHPATSNGENKGAFPFGAPNLDSHSEEKRENENILVSIFDDYPNVWRQPNRFRALLMDLLPQDKLRRNLLYICVEEQIPDNLCEKTEITNMEMAVFKKKIIGACGCSESLAAEVVGMWVSALKVTVIDTSSVNPRELPIDELELSVRSYNCLKRAGINTLGDLENMTPSEMMRKIRNLGRKSLEEILSVMKQYGITLKKDEEENNDANTASSDNRKIELQTLYDNGEISIRTHNCLRRAGMLTLGDVADRTPEDMMHVRNLGRKCLDEILRVLKQYGLQLKEEEKPELESHLAEMNLDDMELSVRSYNCLRRAGISKLHEIIDLSGEDFVKIRNLGLKSAQEVVTKLAELGVPYELRKHLNKAIADRKEAMRRDQESKSNEPEETTDIGAQLQMLQMQMQLKMASEKANADDYVGFLEHFEKAVDLGFNGNYSMIGQLYLAGINGVPKDLSKGFKWLQRFYDDFKAGKLELDDNSVMIEVCHHLGAIYFLELQSGNHSTVLKQYKIKNILDLWKEAIDFGPEEKDVDDSESTADKLFTLGCCFYYGEIRLEGVENVSIQADYEYAYKAFTEAERLGNVAAITLLAEMYEEGKFVEQNEISASNKYLRAAIKGEENAIEWCQKHFIDNLPWNKQSDWSNILIADEFQGVIANVAEQLGCGNLEEIRNFKFEELEDNGSHISELSLRRLFVRVANFVENYEPSPDAELKSVIGIVDVANTVSAYGYDEKPGTEVEDIFSWLKTFYEAYQDESVQLTRGYEDIARVEYKLGICYAYGLGTETDTAKAVELLSKVVLHGKEQHQDLVLASSVYLFVGEISAIKDEKNVSIERDYKQAYRGFKKLSTKGNSEATYYLAKMFEDGNYVEQDLRQAIKLYKSSAEGGYALAEQWLKEKDY